MAIRWEFDIVDKIACVILAGGQGTRLFPLTQSRCKPAVSFGGRYRLIDIPISNALNSQIRQIFIVSQHLANTLNEHILATYRLDDFQKGAIQQISPQEINGKKMWFEGTADAIRKNLDLFLKTSAEYFLILSGDQLYTIDFAEMFSFAVETDADLVIASLPVEKKDATRLGLLSIDSEQRILDFYEKPQEETLLKRFEISHSKTPPEYLASMGIYIFKRKTLETLLQEEGEDFGKHLIPVQVKRGKTFAYIYKGYWEDIGTVRSFYEANLALTQMDPRQLCLDTYHEEHPIYTCRYNLPSPILHNTQVHHSIISQGSIVKAVELSHSIVGVRCLIEEGSIIRDSIFLGNHFYSRPLSTSDKPFAGHFTLGKNCHLEKTIVDEMCSIGDNVKLINEKNLQTYDGNGVYIRDGIIVVSSGTHLPSGFRL